MNYNSKVSRAIVPQDFGEPDCSPHPFDIMAIEACIKRLLRDVCGPEARDMQGKTPEDILLRVFSFFGLVFLAWVFVWFVFGGGCRALFN